MKKLLIIFLIAFNTFNSYSQINFEKGYFINDFNDKTDCLIKNVEWKNNPSTFEYKLSEDSELQTANIQNVKEFGVSNFKFQRFSIKIDQSSNKLGDLNYEADTKFVEETLYLKVLIEGNANLYLYEDGSLRRYFYSIDGSEVEPLVYKRYLIHGNSKIGENKGFQQQLWNDLKCKDINLNEIKNVDYTQKDLLKFFTKYNNCVGSTVNVFEKKEKRDLFNLNIRMGINVSSLEIYRKGGLTYRGNFDYGNQTSFRPGIEFEYILPFNKNKWSVVFEPSYQQFEGLYESTELTVPRYEYISVDYAVIDLLIGIRHYFFLNDKSKIFITGAYVAGLNMKSDNLRYQRTYEGEKGVDFDNRYNPNLGLGFSYNRLSLEFKYNFSTSIIDKYFLWSSAYDSFSVIVGYNIL